MAMDPKKLKVSELKEELQKRSLDTSGLKAQLLQRLEEALAAESFGEPAQTSAAGQPAPSQENGSGSAAADSDGQVQSAAPAKAFSKMTEQEKLEARAAKWGTTLQQKDKAPKDEALKDKVAKGGKRQKGAEAASDRPAKKQKESPAKKYTLEEMEVIARRCARFNTPLPPGVLTPEEIELRRKRAERFQQGQPASSEQ